MFWLWVKVLAAGTSAATAPDGNASNAAIEARSTAIRMVRRTASSFGIGGYRAHDDRGMFGFLDYFVAAGRPLANTIGLGNWTGLAALVIVVGLLAISADRAMWELKATRWKRLQRLNYALFALVVLHAFFYGALLRMTSPSRSCCLHRRRGLHGTSGCGGVGSLAPQPACMSGSQKTFPADALDLVLQAPPRPMAWLRVCASGMSGGWRPNRRRCRRRGAPGQSSSSGS